MNDVFAPILAFDTAMNGCTVAVQAGDRRATRLFPTDREQAARLIPLINEALEEAGIAYVDLGLIVTTVGPGSFTGLRIGLATARALGLALDVPVQGVSTFAAMAASCREQGDEKPCRVILETKRSDFYVQDFTADLSPDGVAVCASLDDLFTRSTGNVILMGDAIARFVEEAGASGLPPLDLELRPRNLIDPLALLDVGRQAFIANGFKADKPVPVYLRGADVSISKKAQREIQDSPL